ncbi:VIT domain-containing protein [Marivirga sp.]|uniref:VIT domain-containing protein n=1 Tax=Marivirga sp. TaxID=2018662 RepID=UPI0025EA0A38|nr:VIT domain-containing protein [Marivirga sp.]
MNRLIFTSVLAIWANILFGQNDIAFPTISTPSENDIPVELKRLHIDVFVTGNFATTTFEMLFYNDNERVMEGELNFPLDNGVTVSRFALDVNGEMREGVVVEKEKATQAFEAVSRRRIDPGLVEVSKGNNFKARIYPIPAKGYKKAILSFEQELTSADNNNYIYQLSLNLKSILEKFSVKVEVVMNKPTKIEGDHPNINLNFEKVRNSFISEYEDDNIELENSLAFLIPKPQEVKEVITYKGKVTSDNYFHINLNINEAERKKEKPSDITIVWDESSSGKNRNIEKELSIIENYLVWMQEGEIELKTFSNTLHLDRKFDLKNGKCPELMEALKSIQYDGATNLYSVDLQNIKSDEIILFSDGLSNFGEQNKLRFNSPVICINSSNLADHNTLESFALTSDGVYLNAFKLTNDEIVRSMQSRQKHFIKSDFDQENIKSFIARRNATGNFSFTGKADGAKNELVLYFGYGDEVTDTHSIVIDNTNRIENNVGERIWAQSKLKSLKLKGDGQEILKHGKKFNLVTEGTSLIVLDEVEDYVNYEITPPESLRKRYYELISQRNKDNSQYKQERLKQLCENFEADINWWDTVEKQKAAKKSKQSEEILMDFAVSEVADEEEMVLEEMVFSMTEQTSDYDNEDDANSNSSNKKASIKLNKWENDASYMSDLKATDPQDLYDQYLSLKPTYAEIPSFYFDVATYMFQKSQREKGLRVISNLAELELENTELLRTLGRKLSEYQFYKEAIVIFKEIESIRSFEPHSYIDLGLTYAEMGKYQQALDHLYTVIDKVWDRDIISRFPGIELIVLHDMNKIIHNHGKELDISGVDECFIYHMPLDIRIVIDWDANETDIDLWVTDPNGEKCSYQNKNTQLGGRMSNDITAGYGPEEFRLKKAIEGNYNIEVNFYGSNKQTVLDNVSVRAIVYTRFGFDNEQKEILTLQLEPSKEGEFTVGELAFEK